MKQRHFRQSIFSAAIASLSLVLVSCGSSVAGTYSDTSEASFWSFVPAVKRSSRLWARLPPALMPWTEPTSI